MCADSIHTSSLVQSAAACSHESASSALVFSTDADLKVFLIDCGASLFVTVVSGERTEAWQQTDISEMLLTLEQSLTQHTRRENMCV